MDLVLEGILLLAMVLVTPAIFVALLWPELKVVLRRLKEQSEKKKKRRT